MATNGTKAVTNGLKNKPNGTAPSKKSTLPPIAGKEKRGKLDRRFSLDIQPTQKASTPRKGSLDLAEPKSILKNKTRRSSVAMGDLPRSTEFEQIMASLLSSQISSSSSESVDSGSGKPNNKNSLDEDNADVFSNSTSDKDITRKCSYRLDEEKDTIVTKKVTFSDNVSTVPST